MEQRDCDIPELENQASSKLEPTNVTKDMERTKKDQKQNQETSADEEEKGCPDHSQERHCALSESGCCWSYMMILW